MISQNGLYATIRGAIKELTDIEVYRNTSQNNKVVGAKWLFVKVVYDLFEQECDRIAHLTKPTYKELALELGYKNHMSISNLLKKYVPTKRDNNLLIKLQALLTDYTDYKITKNQLNELLISERLTLVDVIDSVIELNGLIGVGLITLSDGIREYIINKNK